ncbi:MAG: hypothetical protein ACI8TP_002026 [Acidimicrobiales bacterium]
MRERQAELDAHDITVVVITFTKPRNLATYRRRFTEPFTVVTDQDLLLYQALGFGRGSPLRVWGWRAARKYIELMRKGARPEKSNEDTLQLGGNALLDANGRLSWVYSGAGPDDRPSIDEIVAQIARL